MEALGAAASVAGIISITGQVLTALIVLRGFFEDIAHAGNLLDCFIQDLNSLIRVLEDVRDVCGRVIEVLPTSSHRMCLATLNIQLEDCSNDVHQWLVFAQRLHIGQASGTKATFKKFIVVANKNCISDVSSRIQIHFRYINCSLEVIGRVFDVLNFNSLQRVDAKTDAFAEFHEWLRNRSFEFQDDMDNISETLSSLSESSDEILCTSIENSLKLDNLEERSKATESRLERIEQLLQEIRKNPSTNEDPPQKETGLTGLLSASLSLPTVWTRSPWTSEHFGRQSPSSMSASITSTAIALYGSEHSQLSGSISFEDLSSTQLQEPIVSEDNDQYEPFQRVTSLEPLPTPEELLQTSRNLFPNKRHDVERSEVFYRRDGLKSPYKSMSDWIYTLYPKAVADYLAYMQLLSFIEQQLRFLEKAIPVGIKSTNLRSPLPFLNNFDELRMAITYMKEDLVSVQEYVTVAKRKCVLKGVDIYEIDRMLEADTRKPLECEKTSRLSYPKEGSALIHHDDIDLYGGSWMKTKDDFINSWLLDTLRASEEAAALHRSFLLDPELDEANWARLVFTHWFHDDAVTQQVNECQITDGAIDSNATRSVFTSGSAGVLVSEELQAGISTRWSQAKAPRARGEASNIYDQLHDRYRCIHCDAVIAETDEYLSHLKTHESDLPFGCTEPGCVKRFGEHHELRLHAELHAELHSSLTIRLFSGSYSYSQKSARERTKIDRKVFGIYTAYKKSVDNLQKVMKALASYKEEYRRIVEERDKTTFEFRQKMLNIQLMALCAIELLTREKVDNAWLNTISWRWQLFQNGVIHHRTSHELAEVEQMKQVQRDRMLFSLDNIKEENAEMQMQVQLLKRKGSCPGRLENAFELYRPESNIDARLRQKDIERTTSNSAAQRESTPNRVELGKQNNATQLSDVDSQASPATQTSTAIGGTGRGGMETQKKKHKLRALFSGKIQK